MPRSCITFGSRAKKVGVGFSCIKTLSTQVFVARQRRAKSPESMYNAAILSKKRQRRGRGKLNLARGRINPRGKKKKRKIIGI
jgi:hypothetical protein